MLLRLAFAASQIYFGEADVGFGLRAEDRDLHLNSGVKIVALKGAEELVVIVEFAEHAINADEFERWKVAALFALEAKFLGAHIGFGQLQAGIILHGHGDEIGAFLFGLAGKIFGQDFHGLIRRISHLRAQENFQFVLAAFQLQNALRDLSFGELRLGDFHGQLETFAFASLRDFENFVGAVLFGAKQVERVANFAEFEISHGGAHDDAVAHVFKAICCDLACS